MAKRMPEPKVRREVAAKLGGLQYTLSRTNGLYTLVIPPGTDGSVRNPKKTVLKGKPNIFLRQLEKWRQTLEVITSS